MRWVTAYVSARSPIAELVVHSQSCMLSSVQVGDCVYPRGFDYKGLRFRCELEGKSGDMEPTWPIVDSPTQHHKIIGTAFTEQGRIYWRCEKEESDVQHLSISEAVNLLWAATPTEILFLGVIDILTAYETKKKAEHFFTGTALCRPVSCQPSKKVLRRSHKLCCARVALSFCFVFPFCGCRTRFVRVCFCSLGLQCVKKYVGW